MIYLCSENSPNKILIAKSPFWAALFSSFEKEPSTDFTSRTKASYILNKARKNEYRNNIYDLTDELYLDL